MYGCGCIHTPSDPQRSAEESYKHKTKRIHRVLFRFYYCHFFSSYSPWIDRFWCKLPFCDLGNFWNRVCKRAFLSAKLHAASMFHGSPGRTKNIYLPSPQNRQKRRQKSHETLVAEACWIALSSLKLGYIPRLECWMLSRFDVMRSFLVWSMWGEKDRETDRVSVCACEQVLKKEKKVCAFQFQWFRVKCKM